MLSERLWVRRMLGLVVAVAGAVATFGSVEAAQNLMLAPGLSFTDDSSDGFPIRGSDLGSAEIAPGRVAIVFFGAAHCWNTNREAERLVAVYPKFREQVSFVVIDVNHPSGTQRSLMRRFYTGYIPTIVLLARDGRVLYSGAGETAMRRGDTQALETLITTAIDGA